jgi:hypothetical protein
MAHTPHRRAETPANHGVAPALSRRCRAERQVRLNLNPGAAARFPRGNHVGTTARELGRPGSVGATRKVLLCGRFSPSRHPSPLPPDPLRSQRSQVRILPRVLPFPLLRPFTAPRRARSERPRGGRVGTTWKHFAPNGAARGPPGRPARAESWERARPPRRRRRGGARGSACRRARGPRPAARRRAEGTAGAARADRERGVGARGEHRDHAADRERRPGEVAGEVDRDAEDAEDAAADHPADGHRDRLAKAERLPASPGVMGARVEGRGGAVGHLSRVSPARNDFGGSVICPSFSGSRLSGISRRPDRLRPSPTISYTTSRDLTPTGNAIGTRPAEAPPLPRGRLPGSARCLAAPRLAARPDGPGAARG